MHHGMHVNLRLSSCAADGRLVLCCAGPLLAVLAAEVSLALVQSWFLLELKPLWAKGGASRSHLVLQGFVQPLVSHEDFAQPCVCYGELAQPYLRVAPGLHAWSIRPPGHAWGMHARRCAEVWVP
jgi:hypothetical protein